MAPREPEAAAPLPRANPLLLGHDKAERHIGQWIAAGSMPHALLICGPWGIGKATLAYRLARRLLSRPSASALRLALPLGSGGGEPGGEGEESFLPEDQGARWVTAGTHPDLLAIERKFDERKGRVQSDIVVDDIRRVSTFLSSSPAAGGWRVVVVDAADEMNRHAANALLKVLEEPNDKSLILLVAHRPAVLPATVRSRCRRLLLEPLPHAVVVSLIERYLPQQPTEDTALLCALAEGSIGRALQLAANDGAAAFRATRAFFGKLADGDAKAVLPDIAEAGAALDEDHFQVTVHVLSWWLRRIAGACLATPRRSGGVAAADENAALAGRLAAAVALDRWLGVWDKTQRLLAEAAAGNLDRSQALVTALLHMHRELHPASF